VTIIGEDTPESKSQHLQPWEARRHATCGPTYYLSSRATCPPRLGRRGCGSPDTQILISKHQTNPSKMRKAEITVQNDRGDVKVFAF